MKIYVTKEDIRVYILYIYMLPIAGQTAGPIGLHFLWTLIFSIFFPTENAGPFSYLSNNPEILIIYKSQC